MKLYSYQEELVNSKSDRIMINWCRGAGKTTGVMAYILENKPRKVLFDTRTFMGMESYLKNNELEDVEVVRSLNYIQIKHLSVNFTTTIEKENISRDTFTENYNLVVFDSEFRNENEIKSPKVIKAITKNIHSYTDKDKEMHSDYEVIEVDYKDALKENAISIDWVIEFATEYSDSFYRQYAIKDKPKRQKVSFESFKEDALQRLQKQFMNTNDSKDTVLTRKNIIEMIKDLKMMENPQTSLIDTLNTQFNILDKVVNSYNFRDGTSENPYMRRLERLQVIGFEVKLSEIPSKYDKVKVYGNNHAWLETSGKDFNFIPYTYNVDYNSGIIKFNPEVEGKELIFDYIGTGNVTK